MEEELEGITREDLETARAYLAPLWTSHTDGSLRNGGVEFVTNGGLGGQNLYSAFERITHLLANVIEYQDTFRCSTHMHVNMLDFTVPQVAKFLMVYAACEPYLFAHCGQYRRSSNFCVPVGDSLPFHKNLIANLYDDSVQLRTGTRVTNKYTAMNLQPLFGSDRVRPIGTVEFRGGRPMSTMEDFLLQANLLLSIKEFVRRGPEDAEELLNLMGDTVTNSVYANGIAGGLTVSQQDLEQATIDAWMLLKAYQQGMKAPRPKKHSFSDVYGESGISARPQTLPTEGFEWGEANAVARETAALQLSFWNSAVACPPNRYLGNVGNMGAMNIGNPYPGNWRGWDRYAQELENQRAGTRGFRDFLAHILTDNTVGVDFTNQEAMFLGIGWQLKGLEASPLHSIHRAMVDKVTRGRQVSIISQRRFDNQPNLKLEGGNLQGLNWRAILGREANHAIAELLDCWVHIGSENELDSFRAFNRIATIKVRVKNREVFRDALTGSVEDMPAITAEMYASELYHLFRIASVNPVNHIHRLDLELYDKVNKSMAILYGAQLTVPVMHAPRPGSWNPVTRDALRLTVIHNTGLGMGYATSEAQRERRAARDVFELDGRPYNLY